jgi:DNA mismatch endonuclease (patch repair protein)
MLWVYWKDFCCFIKKIMADVHTKEIRSFNMSRIRSKNTRPELAVRKFLHAAGFRYRLHDKKLPGKPDIVLPKYRTVIFVHGCFWHGHRDCRYFVVPKTRTDWWLDKINGNIEKDVGAAAALRNMGWQVLEIWECGLKKNTAESEMQRVTQKLYSQT